VTHGADDDPFDTFGVGGGAPGAGNMGGASDFGSFDDDPLDPLAGDPNAPELQLAVPEKPKRKPRDEKKQQAKKRQKPEETVTQLEVVRLARYGAKPSGFFAAVPYAIHVFNRWRELRAALAALERRHEAATSRADVALANMGRALHARKAELENDPEAGQLVTALKKIEDAHGKANAAMAELSEAQQTADAERAQLDAQIQAADAAATPFRDREAKLQRELDVLTHELKRRQGALQRAEIELRNADDATGLESARDARRAEVQSQQQKVQEKQAALGETRKELAKHSSALNEAQRARQRLEKDIEGSLKRVKSAQGESSAELDASYVEAANIARRIGEDSELELDFEEAHFAEKACSGRDQLAREKEMHRRALKAYDKNGLRLGGGFIGVVLAAILAMIVVAIAM